MSEHGVDEIRDKDASNTSLETVLQRLTAVLHLSCTEITHIFPSINDTEPSHPSTAIYLLDLLAKLMNFVYCNLSTGAVQSILGLRRSEAMVCPSTTVTHENE
jgi:hypothetical protein